MTLRAPENSSLSTLLINHGFLLTQINLAEKVQAAVLSRNWVEVDELIRKETSPGGAVFQRLSDYAKFSEIEFLISIRSSDKEPDEDGIWHDDGSRELAFSLSLNLNPTEIEGGTLELKRQSDDEGAAQ